MHINTSTLPKLIDKLYARLELTCHSTYVRLGWRYVILVIHQRGVQTISHSGHYVRPQIYHNNCPYSIPFILQPIYPVSPESRSIHCAYQSPIYRAYGWQIWPMIKKIMATYLHNFIAPRIPDCRNFFCVSDNLVHSLKLTKVHSINSFLRSLISQIIKA